MSASVSSLEKHAASYAAFRVQDSLVEILPSLDLPRLPLLSHTPTAALKAGLPQSVPLWMAVILQQRSLCTIACPAWLTVDNLVEILQYEKTQAGLWPEANRLPYFYVELSQALLSSGSTNSSSRVSLESDETSSVLGLLVQDLVQVRVDKLRQQFQQLLAADSVTEETVDWVVSINGMGAHESAILQPFVQQALSDWRFLHQGNVNSTAAKQVEGSGDPQGTEGAKGLGMRRARVPIRRHR